MCEKREIEGKMTLEIPYNHRCAAGCVDKTPAISLGKDSLTEYLVDEFAHYFWNENGTKRFRITIEEIENPQPKGDGE